ncbi:hypothetical protein F511_06291 [Dorcoceras hygrometricum]|uniref:Integrase zinc-binding domain-containing protein n=1 Tax=Dorcoceras hygrometricum TaxID=472368 RepID=A0A2Z7AEL2_9LAMI|nr:hypothetical protein F511_06291 [Dorcoceras hygrometricum]
MVHDYVAALTLVETDFFGRVQEVAEQDITYLKLLDQVKAGEIRKYWIEDGILYAKGGRSFIPSGALRNDLLKDTHDSQWAGHTVVNRMMDLLSRKFYWPNMDQDVEKYVKTCLVCHLDKSELTKEAGLLQPLSIPERPWKSISMDFILGFPNVGGMASILIVVDMFSKYADLIVAPKVFTAEHVAELFLKDVIKYLGYSVHWTIVDSVFQPDGVQTEVFHGQSSSN